MDKKCSKCTRPCSKKDAHKVKLNNDLEKPHKQDCPHKTVSKHSADKPGCSCKKSRSQVRIGADSQLKVDLKKSKNDIKVDVSSICAETTSSGGINIPVNLLVSVKKSGKDVVHCESSKYRKVTKPPVDLVYNSCTINIYCDPYINEMAELNDKFYSLHANKRSTGSATSKNEMLCTSGTNSYIEQYTLLGYTDQSQENVGIQTDLVLGALLQSQSLQSIKEPEPERTKSADTCICRTTKTNTKDPNLPWTELLLPGYGTYNIDTIEKEVIDMTELEDTFEETTTTSNKKSQSRPTTPPQTESKKKPGLFKCCRCCNKPKPSSRPPSPASRPPTPPEPTDILLVYNSHCGKTEPYIYQLVEYSTIPVPKGMSWGTIEIPRNIIIRVMLKCTCKPAPMPSPMPQLLKPKCTVCKMKLHKSAPALRAQILPPKITPSKCDSCGLKSTKSEGTEMTASKHSVNFKGCAKSVCDKVVIPLKMEVLYKQKNDSISNTKVDNFCPPCNKSVSPGYDPCTIDDSDEYFVKSDPVDTALRAFEAELKPMKTTLNMLQQKLKNLNMPELDFMFNKPQVAVRPKVTKVTKINLSESIKLLYCPHKKSLKNQRFARVSPKRRSKSKLSRAKSRSRSRSCSRCSSRSSSKSKTAKKGKSRSSKHRKGKSHRRSSKHKSGSTTSSQKSIGSNRSASRNTSSCDSCKIVKKLVLRHNNKSPRSSYGGSTLPSTSASPTRPKSRARMKSFRIRSKNYSKNVSRTSSQASALSECPFLEAIKSILVDRQKITQQNCNQTQNIENIRMHVRLQPRKKKR